MHRLIDVKHSDHIPSDFKNTPIADLILYHNLKSPHKPYQKAELLIGMCMDHRKSLNIPKNFAYIVRSGGANVRHNEFHISYAIGVGGIKFITLMGHTQCGMVHLNERKEQFIQGLCDNAGWDSKQASEYFDQNASSCEIGNEVDFVVSETGRLSKLYPQVKIAPLLYKVEDHLLYWIDAKSSTSK